MHRCIDAWALPFTFGRPESTHSACSVTAYLVAKSTSWERFQQLLAKTSKFYNTVGPESGPFQDISTYKSWGALRLDHTARDFLMDLTE